MNGPQWDPMEDQWPGKWAVIAMLVLAASTFAFVVWTESPFQSKEKVWHSGTN